MEKPIMKDKRGYKSIKEVLQMSENNLYMIEAIDNEKNIISIANYIFRKKYDVSVNDAQIKRYAMAFNQALNDNMYLSVEYDEERGVIIG